MVNLYVLARTLAHQLGACCSLVRCHDWFVDAQRLGTILRLCCFCSYGWIYDLGVHLCAVTWRALRQRTASNYWLHSGSLYHSVWRFLKLVCVSQLVAKELTNDSSDRGSNALKRTQAAGRRGSTWRSPNFPDTELMFLSRLQLLISSRTYVV